MALGGARSDVERMPPRSAISDKALGCSGPAYLSVKWGSNTDFIDGREKSPRSFKQSRTRLEREGTVGALCLARKCRLTDKSGWRWAVVLKPLPSLQCLPLVLDLAWCRLPLLLTLSGRVTLVESRIGWGFQAGKRSRLTHLGLQVDLAPLGTR